MGLSPTKQAEQICDLIMKQLAGKNVCVLRITEQFRKTMSDERWKQVVRQVFSIHGRLSPCWQLLYCNNGFVAYNPTAITFSAICEGFYVPLINNAEVGWLTGPKSDAMPRFD